VGRLVRAHVDLFKAELGEIADQVKVIAALGGALAGIGLFVANLLLIGTFLFLGEWLLGSLGWGVLHGTLLGIGVMTAVALVLMTAPARLPLTAFLVSALVGLIVAVALALNLARRAAEAGANAVRASVPTLDPGWAPIVVTVALLATVGGLIGLLLGVRAGGARSAILWLLGGAVVGALAGLVLGGQIFSIQGAAALGITTALVLWIALQVRGAIVAKIKPAARFERLWPRETYETALETRTWLEKEWARRRERLASR
jgi:hypothetical protein